MRLRVLIGCERSGKVRDAFIARGHEAYSCDLVDSLTPGPHLKCSVLDVLNDGWDLAIFHPDCTYLCGSGLHWNCRTPGRYLKTRAAIDFVERLWDCNIPKIAIENPIGCLSTFSKLMKHTQIVQPYEYGHDASKATCLWLKNLPELVPPPGAYVVPRIVGGKERWGNQTDSGQNKLAPSDGRSMARAETYQGIADAMAEQWGAL